MVPQPEADPTQLARLIVRCRELHGFVEQVQPNLPSRAESPFLHGQLEDVIRLLRESLKRFDEGAPEESGRGSRRDGLFGRLLGRNRATGKGERRRVDLQGNSWTVPVSELVGFLSNSGKTGILSVHTNRESYMIEMRDGDLVRAKSDHTPDGHRLGELLVAAGALDEDEVPVLVEEARSKSKHLGSHLLDAARVTKGALREALGLQVQALFYRLMSTENAVYEFQEGAALSDAQDLDLNVMQLLLEGARLHDESVLDLVQLQTDEDEGEDEEFDEGDVAA
jgi:hypothetical protein